MTFGLLPFGLQAIWTTPNWTTYDIWTTAVWTTSQIDYTVIALWQSFNGRCDIQNFELIRVQIFQIDFPLIISASKYFRQISLSFYIRRGQNEQTANALGLHLFRLLNI